ncbi:histidine kinase [Pelomonas sp. V22]|uniref:sensor histidine kinase n=1 Tax=Pelomonas sp. V22 TaxID=2822139 RepID=UPI0024A845D3|nr:histidine kinase [Pelomonas sp. V22]MDI4632208.1 histidine kinase [Pelomonas sp. V22]
MSHTIPWSERSRRDWLHWAAWQVGTVAAAGLAVTIGLVLLLRQPFSTTLVFCLCIAAGCSILVQALRTGADLLLPRLLRRPTPAWLREPVSLVFGTALGYHLGNQLGSLLTGIASAGIFDVSPRRALTMLFIALVPGIAITVFFVGMSRLQKAETQAQQAARIAAETQLRLLESQLEPHMLFNTLANLRVLIGMDPARAQAMLDQLIAFLRATLQASRSISHPLSAEFARLTDYLALMQVRMGARLQPRFELPAELTGVEIPPLLLQPLVENAIKHGLEPHVEGGELVVSAAREAEGKGQVLLLQVRDSGAGLSDTPDTAGTGFGLQQVRERLATRYGPGARLDIAPAAGGGTLCSIRIPLP